MESPAVTIQIYERYSDKPVLLLAVLNYDVLSFCGEIGWEEYVKELKSSHSPITYLGLFC